MCFDSITSLITHKRHYCKLRFTCKCEADTERLDNCGVPNVVTCSTCGQDFDDPWDLMEHVQVKTLTKYNSSSKDILLFRTCTLSISISSVTIIRMFPCNENGIQILPSSVFLFCD